MLSDKAKFQLLENSEKPKLSLFDQQCLKNCDFLKKFTISYCSCGFLNCIHCSCSVCKLKTENCVCQNEKKK